MTSPLPNKEYVAIDTPASDRGPISVGAGAAITGIYVSGHLLVGLLLILNYTDLLVGNDVNRVTYPDNLGTFGEELFILAVSLSPMIFSYRVCAKIIDKA